MLVTEEQLVQIQSDRNKEGVYEAIIKLYV